MIGHMNDENSKCKKTSNIRAKVSQPREIPFIGFDNNTLTMRVDNRVHEEMFGEIMLLFCDDCS